jgi:protein-S-isoprenylcysteine O-methyltransferase Ste14
MQPLVLHEELAQAVFWISFAVWGAIELFMLVRSRIQLPSRSGIDPSQVLLLGSMLAGVALGAYAADHVGELGLPGGGWWPVITGLAVLWLGVGFRVWAVQTLGRFFQYTVVVQPEQRVIEEGPYRRIRHPSYTGLVLGMLGLGIALDNALAIAACALLPLLAFTLRLMGEEKALSRELGEPYRDYMRRTHRLIPGVW